MSNFSYAIPFVAAIIERNTKDGTELLLQTRMNQHGPERYNGTIEFAAGTLDKPYENVYEALKREVKEETGLTVKRFMHDSHTDILQPQGDDAVHGFRPYCCTQQLKEGKPWVGFIFRCEVEDGEPVPQDGETQNVRWVSVKEFYQLYTSTPEKIFSLELPAWEYYFADKRIKNEN